MNDGLETREDIEDARNRATRAIEVSQGPVNIEDLVNSAEAYPIYDLITNLLHLGDRYGFKAEDLIASAELHYYAGRFEDDE